MLLDLFLYYIAYKVGYAFLKLISLGKYPKEYVIGGEIGVELLGVIVSVILLVIAFYFIF
jgi:hypothetical protein